jgi:hypothetical protein
VVAVVVVTEPLIIVVQVEAQVVLDQVILEHHLH